MGVRGGGGGYCFGFTGGISLTLTSGNVLERKAEKIEDISCTCRNSGHTVLYLHILIGGTLWAMC